jgi:Fe-S cluster assembly protein SufD
VSPSPLEQSFRRAFEAAPARREPPWLARLRSESFAEFAAHGLPTTKQEDWRFTSLAKLERLEPTAPPAGAAVELEAALARVGGQHRMVFVNGRFAPALSRVGALPAGCSVEPLAQVLAREPGLVSDLVTPAKGRPLAALNTALFEDGAFVYIDRHARVDEPIHLIFANGAASTPFAAHPRNVIVAGTHSRAQVVEHHVGGAGGVANAVTELAVEDGAALDYTLLQELDASSFGFFALIARQQPDSRLALRSIALGAALARVEIEARLEGEGAALELDGLYLARDSQHQDHHTTVDHASPRTTSRELFKGILDGRAHGVFHGRVHVRPDAQKIDASQTNRALLLSDGAVLDSKPQLEIYADDVKCSHGASVGQLDPDQIFYLRARGLSLERARALLTFAFASEVLAKLPLAALRESLEATLLEWLPLGGAR